MHSVLSKPSVWMGGRGQLALLVQQRAATSQSFHGTSTWLNAVAFSESGLSLFSSHWPFDSIYRRKMRSLVWYEAQAAEDGVREKALRYVDDAKIKDSELQYKHGSSTTLVFRCFTTRQWKKTKKKPEWICLKTCF